ncbi:hypothetical protein PSECIP111854_03696 [Pseudoalteromonas sp. CIP111854]|uniref:Protein TonB n=1 Tax=Pseudoalteromonas holothuriae TaxID=2963714 RepID=A0A9W4R3Q3_9GAMM|nr:TonB family protein [Pseudoalteromonas sp. CIP111854]CAH9065496.1 hypothetical protein PSECIP111854_03696 [Pseudoalteromonas sp. CIP111854]
MLYLYAEWLLNFNTQIVISAIMVTLMLLQKYATTWLSARLVYALWWMVPLSVIALCLPNELKPITSQAISYFKVTPQTSQVSGFWQLNATLLYLIVTISLLMFVFWQHYKFVKTLNLEPTGDLNYKSPIFVSAKLSTPMAVGLWQPCIVLPKDYQKQFAPDTLKLLLEHEHTHIQRYDNLANMALLLLCISCWFNPLLWLGYQSFRRTQELACDETVLQQKTTHQQLMYAKALVHCAKNNRNSALAYSFYGDKSTMKQRLTHLQNLKNTSLGAKCLVIALACCSLSAMALSKPNEIQANKQVNEPHPIMRIEPLYPIEAANAGISGYVTLQFTIDERGHTNNIEVIDAQPNAVFEKSAINALRQWQYSGATHTSERHIVQLDYALSPQSKADKKKVNHERISVSH